MSRIHDEKVWIAEAILRHRRKRTEVLPSSLFAEHPWDALLLLFIADASSDRLNGDDLARRIGCSANIMSRWIKHMSNEGLIVGDHQGAMDASLVLTPGALQSIEVFLTDVQELGEEFWMAREERRRGNLRPI